MTTTIEIKKGKALSDKEIEMMEKQRIKEYGKIGIDFRKGEKNSIFFFVKEGKVIAFGMLTPISITYLRKKYNMLGICNMISIKKKKGYGKILIQSMIDYLKKKDKTGLGFCDKKVTKFYEKSGLKTEKDLALRFRYKYATPEEERRELEEGGDGIYYEGKDKFISKIISTKDLVYIEVQFW